MGHRRHYWNHVSLAAQGAGVLRANPDWSATADEAETETVPEGGS